MQDPLFRLPSPSQSGLGPKGPLDAHSERLLHLYRRLRTREGGKDATVDQEVSHIRSLYREGLRRGLAPTEIFRKATLLADILIHPSTYISPSTGRKRLVACQNFARLCGVEVGVTDYGTFLAALDAHLPSSDDGSLHGAGTIVAGAKVRRRRRNPTLSPADLRRLEEEAFIGDSRRDGRNRAILALHCHSGLLPSEIAGLKTEQIKRGDGRTPTVVEVERKGMSAEPWIADDAIRHLDRHLANQPPTGPDWYVFTKGRTRPKPLTREAVRNVLREACRRLGLPPMTTDDLRSAFAYSLRAKGFSDHEVMTALGLENVKSIDRRLNGHLKLDSQRRVHEILPEIDPPTGLPR